MHKDTQTHRQMEGWTDTNGQTDRHTHIDRLDVVQELPRNGASNKDSNVDRNICKDLPKETKKKRLMQKVETVENGNLATHLWRPYYCQKFYNQHTEQF